MEQIFCLTFAKDCSLYFFQFLQMQRADHLPIDEISYTREPPDVVNAVCEHHRFVQRVRYANAYASSSSLRFSAGILGIHSPRHMTFAEKEKRHGSESKKDGGNIDTDTYGSPRAFHPATAGISDNL